MSDGLFELVPLANVAPPNHHPLSTTPHDCETPCCCDLLWRQGFLSNQLLSLPTDGYADRAVLLMVRPRLLANIRFAIVYFPLFPVCYCNTDLCGEHIAFKRTYYFIILGTSYLNYLRNENLLPII